MENRNSLGKPLFLDKEWHLNEMNVRAAWKKNITGKNITVCVVDNGIFYNPDLEIKETKVNPIIEDINLIITGQDYTHGTAVAGIIAAKGNKYTIGIAYNCKLVGYNYLGSLNVTDKYPLPDFILDNNNKIDIFNNSWGPIQTSPNKHSDKTLEIIKAIKLSSKKGRDKKGNLFVFASGNDNLRGGLASYVLLKNSRYTITVGAINSNLDNSTYSSIGTAVLCVAPAGNDVSNITRVVRTSIVTYVDQFGITTTLPYTRKLGKSGLIPYTHDMNGTSASCPMVTGCIALLLSYRHDLTWRDVKELISRSCYQDYFENDTVPNFIINGRKQLVSQRSGYGIINVKKLIRNAKKWTLLPKEKKIHQEKELNITLNQENRTFSVTFDIDKKITIETVQVYLTVNSNPAVLPQLILNMKVNLISPDGTNLILINNQSGFVGTESFVIESDLQYYDNEPFLCELLRGENSQGTWTVQFTWNLITEFPSAINILKHIKLDIYGH